MAIQSGELLASECSAPGDCGSTLMPLYLLDPLADSRWNAFVTSHPRASVFHQTGWLKALARTYDYRPLVLTSAREGEQLRDGIVFAEIKSWVTGSRLVSLPFADHCDPLLNRGGDITGFVAWIQAQCCSQPWNYAELRPLSSDLSSGLLLQPSQSFWFHTLSLTRSLETIFSGFHANCMQRRIRRAERANLAYERSCSTENLRDFYKLLVITRRRHQLPPQPLAWFRNLIACMGAAANIRVARKDGNPVAATLTLRHGPGVVYKYGCSDESYHHLAAMPFLFWRLIEESKAEDAEQIDFGRTDLSNPGLAAFKDHFGAARSTLTYFRYPNPKTRGIAVMPHLPAPRRLFSWMPDAIARRVGEVLYRHIG